MIATNQLSPVELTDAYLDRIARLDGLFDDATVMRAGDAYEQATPWRDRRPELKAA